MDEQTSVLICLAAAVSANCVSCFQHYHGEARKIGLAPSEIEAAVALGAKVKAGANIAVMSAVGKALHGADRQGQADGCAPSASCCAGNG